MARIKEVWVTQSLFQIIMTEGWQMGKNASIRCIEGLPEGAELINSYYDGRHRTAVLVFYHESFEDIPLGGVAPVVDIAWQEGRTRATSLQKQRDDLLEACEMLVERAEPEFNEGDPEEGWLALVEAYDMAAAAIAKARGESDALEEVKEIVDDA